MIVRVEYLLCLTQCNGHSWMSIKHFKPYYVLIYSMVHVWKKRRCADLVMSIVRIHISVRQMCVMCVELWRVEESSLPSTPHSLPSQAVLAAVVYYKPVIYITCSFVLLLTFCQSVAHFGIPLPNSERNTTPIPLEGNLSGHPKSLVYDYLASS